MAGPARVAVQVVNYRTLTYLEKCVATVAADLTGAGIDHEINLLENASGEDLSELAAGVAGCRAFTAPSNLGFGAGHNLLAGKTAARYLLIVNPDVEFVTPGTTSRLLEVIAGDGRIKAVGPRLITESGDTQRWDHGRLHGLRAQISLRAGHSYWRETSARQDVAWVSGAALMVERAAFSAIGGFDENLFLYKEDEDLCLRLRQSGGLVIYEPSVVVRHHGSVATDRPEALVEASRYYFAKHFPHRRTRRAFDIAHNWLAHLRL